MTHMRIHAVARQRDAHVLHHARVAMQQDVAVEHEVADESLIAGSQGHAMFRLEHDVVPPLPIQPGKVRVVSRARRVDHVLALSVHDRDDLERIDMNVKLVAIAVCGNRHLPFLDPAERQVTIDSRMIIELLVDQKVRIGFNAAGSENSFLPARQFFVGDRVVPNEGGEPQPLLKVVNYPASDLGTSRIGERTGGCQNQLRLEFLLRVSDRGAALIRIDQRKDTMVDGQVGTSALVEHAIAASFREVRTRVKIT